MARLEKSPKSLHRSAVLNAIATGRTVTFNAKFVERRDGAMTARAHAGRVTTPRPAAYIRGAPHFQPRLDPRLFWRMSASRLSWNEIRNRASGFSKEWKESGYERGQTGMFYQAFFEVFGVSVRRVATFEEPVKLLEDVKRRGFLDLFWKGVVLVERRGSASTAISGSTTPAATTRASRTPPRTRHTSSPCRCHFRWPRNARRATERTPFRCPKKRSHSCPNPSGHLQTQSSPDTSISKATHKLLSRDYNFVHGGASCRFDTHFDSLSLAHSYACWSLAAAKMTGLRNRQQASGPRRPPDAISDFGCLIPKVISRETEASRTRVARLLSRGCEPIQMSRFRSSSHLAVSSISSTLPLCIVATY